MLDKNFVPPSPEVAKKETTKRLQLADDFLPNIQPAISALMISGSVAYGKNYSVTEKSDIDMQLLITPQTVENLLTTDFFDSANLYKAIEAYRAGIIKQFSLSFEKDGVQMECHFWDEDAFFKAITFESASTVRIRSQIITPAVDYAYSFDGSENKLEIFGSIINGYPVSDFPSYRIVDGTIYFCRPVTNALGCPHIVYGQEKLLPYIDKTWQKAIQYLVEFNSGEIVDLSKINIVNTMPGKNKVSEHSKIEILKRTKNELDSLGQKYL